MNEPCCFFRFVLKTSSEFFKNYPNSSLWFVEFLGSYFFLFTHCLLLTRRQWKWSCARNLSRHPLKLSKVVLIKALCRLPPRLMLIPQQNTIKHKQFEEPKQPILLSVYLYVLSMHSIALVLCALHATKLINSKSRPRVWALHICHLVLSPQRCMCWSVWLV